MAVNDADTKVSPAAQIEVLDNGELPQAIDKALASGQQVQMRSELDDVPILQAVRIYWRVALICMLAAFSAALEGYRTCHTLCSVGRKLIIQNCPCRTPLLQTRASFVRCLEARKSSIPSTLRSGEACFRLGSLSALGSCSSSQTGSGVDTPCSSHGWPSLWYVCNATAIALLLTVFSRSHSSRRRQPHLETGCTGSLPDLLAEPAWA